MLETAQLAQKLTSEGERLALFFETLGDHQWKTEVYTEGSIWTIRSILAHLVTAERAFIRLFESIRRDGLGVPPDFSVDGFNARQQEKTSLLSPGELLAQFRMVRAEMVGFVSRLKDEELEKTGRHPFLQITTLREMIKMVYIHNQIHYRDLRRVLK